MDALSLSAIYLRKKRDTVAAMLLDSPIIEMIERDGDAPRERLRALALY